MRTTQDGEGKKQMRKKMKTRTDETFKVLESIPVPAPNRSRLGVVALGSVDEL